MTKRLLVLIISILILIVWIIFIYIKSGDLYRYVEEHREEWVSRPIKNPPSSLFIIERFPAEYREKTRWGEDQRYTRPPYLIDWATFWYANYERLVNPLLKRPIIAKKSFKVTSVMQELHPIFSRSLSSERLAQLQKTQDMNNYEEYLEFLGGIEEIGLKDDESNPWRDPSWVEAKDDWERRRTQAMILGLYLLYLDDQPILDPEIYDDLDLFISNIGDQEGWYDDFANHLDKYWPEG